jgi:uncharacterized protein YqeY
MTIQEQVKENMKEAMKAKDSVRLSVSRGLMAAFTNELVALGKTPQDSLADEEALKVINRAAKQRKDSIEQFEAGGRPELAADEKSELEIIEEYLPEMMSEEEIRKIAEDKKLEVGAESKADFGKLMGAVVGATKGQADGAVVKKIVEEILG